MLFKAAHKGIVSYRCLDLRDFGLGQRKTVDDTPYGGGSGMVLMIEPLTKAVEFAKQQTPSAKVLLMTPRGDLWVQSLAKEYATRVAGSAESQDLIIICGRYEGYDERITSLVDQQISVGNYVMTGGEIPAMAVVDSIVRLLPGVLGGETSAEQESFYDDDKSVEAPQYTRPEVFRGQAVPPVLLSGDHAKIKAWRASGG